MKQVRTTRDTERNILVLFRLCRCFCSSRPGSSTQASSSQTPRGQHPGGQLPQVQPPCGQPPRGQLFRGQPLGVSLLRVRLTKPSVCVFVFQVLSHVGAFFGARHVPVGGRKELLGSTTHDYGRLQASTMLRGHRCFSRSLLLGCPSSFCILQGSADGDHLVAGPLGMQNTEQLHLVVLCRMSLAFHRRSGRHGFYEAADCYHILMMSHAANTFSVRAWFAAGNELRRSLFHRLKCGHQSDRAASLWLRAHC
jgi:hypothetical protein